MDVDAMRVARESSQEAAEESKLGMMVAKAREWQWGKKKTWGIQELETKWNTFVYMTWRLSIWGQWVSVEGRT